MGLILHKDLSTNSGHYISMVKVGDIWFECDDVKITKMGFNNFCNSDTVYVILQMKHMMETFKGYWAGPNRFGLLSELRRRHGNSILNRFLLKSSYCLLSITFVTFLIQWPYVSFCRSCFVCSGLTYDIYSGGGPSTYIVWFVIM